MNTSLGSEVRGINRMVHGYIHTTLKEETPFVSHCNPLNPKVAALLSALPIERIDLFDVPLCSAIESNNPDFWNSLVSKQEKIAFFQQEVGAKVDWRQELINRTILMFARDLARDNIKLCQCMLGVSKTVADTLAKLTILRVSKMAQEYEQLLFTIREGDNLAFWEMVAVSNNNDDKKIVKILNNRLKMRSFTKLYPVASEIATGWVI